MFVHVHVSFQNMWYVTINTALSLITWLRKLIVLRMAALDPTMHAYLYVNMHAKCCSFKCIIDADIC